MTVEPTPAAGERHDKLLKRGAIFQGELKKTVAAAQIELGADVGAVGFNGTRADEQFRRDLPAGLLLRNQLQDASLGFGQVIQTGPLQRECFRPATPSDQVTGEGGTQIMLAGHQVR